jgi:ribosomal protein S18 acetylase RimI-like enzyme
MLINLRTTFPWLWRKKISQFIKIHEVKDEYNIRHTKNLLYAYGAYMYEELQLKAGKESFYYDLLLFPGMKFSRPDGLFLVALAGNEAAGCVGLKRFSHDSCEMKRLFVLPHFRAAGIGRLLNSTIIKAAKEMGYKKMLLDTNLEMTDAINLYKKSGFKEIPPYCENENPNAVFMELTLSFSDVYVVNK